MSAVPRESAVEVLSSDEVRLLAEIGFMACRGREPDSAIAIFEGLRELRSGHSFVFLGRAMARMSGGRSEEAVRILRDEGLQALPDDEELQVFLAIALKEVGRERECRRVLELLVARSGTPSAPRRLAAALLSEMTDGLPAPAMVAASPAKLAGLRRIV